MVALSEELRKAWEIVLFSIARWFSLQIADKAEREGFEPSRRLNTAYAISNRAPSANSDTSPEATDGSLPKSETAATAGNSVRVPS